ncbi:MAG: bifunctional phosphopantothenoylcysteine decarboxylase/phosphopantothenate--cysteine ligase CoaBC [Bacteroidia bacterium]|nr:bifunctional phosphopantothenoylcysteine decarboxylase/phosphopantothenate--cysteine ligase CoaBC [Bacteroidia bacterium]MDW8302521.1 bifunctional phosphopantothenoylcysteine decarboxylase/phosphopantothenate--cysteine ligase CoaBC [Bacteroidia bacterium]
MSVLQGKKVILAVSGSIASYKSVELLRLLIKAGAEVQVLLTPSAQNFVTPLTFSTLSKKPVFSAIFDEQNTQQHWANHVALGKWADIMIIAPATNNTIAKLANGICDNIVHAVYLSATCPVIIAPAMDLDMQAHPSLHKNIQTLKEFGNIVLPTNSGELASGLIGYGRMLEPQEILDYAIDVFMPKWHKSLSHRSVLITAGPTQEPIDPVRYISNYSTGKMGYAIADAYLKQGAKVFLISGPSNVPPPNSHSNLTLIKVKTAQEMFEATQKYFSSADTFVMTAAVSDYKPKETSLQKIKKHAHQQNLEITLIQNPDILHWVGHHKKQNDFVVGFALESHNEEEYAIQKLISKKADMIVLNSTQSPNATFAVDTNEVTVYTHTHPKYHIPNMPKKELAYHLVHYIETVRT